MSHQPARLDRLASSGFSAVPPSAFADLAQDCWDWCEASGDGRYCSLSRMLTAVDAWWSEYEAIPRSLSDAIESTLKAWLGDVLTAPDAATGANLARLLRQQVLALLLPPQRWTIEPEAPVPDETTEGT